MKIREEVGAECGRVLGDLFVKPWIAMVAWGAFVHMTGFNLPFLSYWQMFMLNLVAGIFTSSRPYAWKVDEDE